MTSTPAAQHFTQLIEQLGPILQESAARHDREGSFVSDSYALLRQHKLLSAAIPAELGGGGLSHSHVCQLLRALAHHCGSTALALSMHTHLVAAAVWRYRHGQPTEALLRKVAASELVLISTGAGDWLDSVGRAERAPGGYRVSAVKRFCSGVPAGDLLMTSAPDLSSEPAEVLHFSVPMGAPGVRVREDWDTLGMRGTGSHSVELDGVFVPEEAIALRRPQGKWHQFWNVIISIAPPIYVAPYIGIAERAAALARQKVTAGAKDTLLIVSLGELENCLTSAHLAWRDMLAITNDYDLLPTLEHANRMLVRKTLAANAAKATVAQALKVVGGAGYFRSFGLERLLRDVEGAPFHPLPELKQLEFSGRVALGLPIEKS